MLTKIRAVGPWYPNIDDLVFNIINKPEMEPFEIRNVDGLGAVNAEINTIPMGSIDEEEFAGGSYGKRNIVLTVGLNSDWDTQTPAKLRRILEQTFMPKNPVKLELWTTDFSPVEIYGYVESNEPSIWSNDPENRISIICPKPNFKATSPVVLSGSANDAILPITYEGTVETGFVLGVNKDSGADPGSITVTIFDPLETSIVVDPADSPTSTTKRLEISTIPGEKYVKRITIATSAEESLLNYATRNGRWPVIGPLTDAVQITSDAGVQDWGLSYYPLVGSL